MVMGPAAQAGMDSAVGLQATLALQTGGRSLRNSNDLGAEGPVPWRPGQDVPAVDSGTS